MVNERIVLDKSRPNKDGSYRVVIYVCHGRGFYLPTGFKAVEKNFKNGRFTKKEPGYILKNDILLKLLQQVSFEISKLMLSDRLDKMSWKELRSHLLQLMPSESKGKKSTEESKDVTFLQCLDRFMSLKTNKGTISCYNTTRNKIIEFDKNCDFDTITTSWLLGFEKWMSRTMKINSYAIHLRNIRTVFNFAIDEGITNNYPFRKFKIKKQETAKRSLTVEQLRTLASYDCDSYQERYRDLFMLDFFLIGMNIGNLLMLTEDNISNGRIEYYRNKTNKLVSVKITPQAQEIINKYRGKQYLLNIMDNYSYYRSFVKRMNVALKQIGTTTRSGLGGRKNREPLFPNISTYWARHTWATIASELDIPIDTISAALSHSVSNSVTSTYIKFNIKKVDDANERVIDYVLRGIS